MSGSPTSLKVSERDHKKVERDRNRDGEIEDLDCKDVDEHIRRKRLAAVISTASNALDVVTSDRAPYRMINGQFARDDCISFSRAFALVLKDERIVATLKSLPPSLLWPGSGLIKRLEEVRDHYRGGASRNKPVSEAVFSAIKMIATDKSLIARLKGEVDEWCDVNTRPPTPTEKEAEKQWYWSKGFVDYHHYEKFGKENDYDSDEDNTYEDLCNDDPMWFY